MTDNALKQILEEEDPLSLALKITSGLDINVLLDDVPPIVWAARNDLWVSVEQLVFHGADPNSLDVSGNSAVHYAVYESNADVVKFLFDQGASMDLVDNEKRPLVNECILSAHLGICKMLIDLGMEVNAPTAPYPLIKSVTNGLHGLTELLLKAGADPYAYADEEDFCLYQAIARNYDFKMVQILLENGVSPMHQGSFKFVLVNEMTEYVELLAGYPLNKNKHGIPAIIEAIQAGLTEKVKLFLANGLDANTHVSDMPLLFHATLHNQLECIIALKDGGATKLHLDDKNICHYYIYNHEREVQLDVIELFLSMGLDPNEQDNEGNTLLHIASMYCEEEHPVIDFLVNETDTSLTNNDGKTAEMLLNDE